MSAPVRSSRRPGSPRSPTPRSEGWSCGSTSVDRIRADQHGEKVTSMPDVVLLSSVFGTVKIAEPMGACILAAAVRERGRSVEILEPSVDGWSVEESVRRVVEVDATVLGISVLRDRNVPDVRRFVTAVRRARPDLVIVIGGHGPSLGLGTLPSPMPVAQLLAAPPPTAAAEPVVI